MNKLVIIAIVLGSLVVIAYVLKELLIKGDGPSLSDGVTIFLSSGGALAGLKVCLISLLSQKFHQSFGSDCTYFFLGGFAVIWVSITTIVDRFR